MTCFRKNDFAEEATEKEMRWALFGEPETPQSPVGF